jgi:hypothetical protein
MHREEEAEALPRAGSVTRRSFLGYAGATAAYLSLWSLPGAALAASATKELDAQSRTTYKALYEGLAERPGYGLHAAYAEAVTGRFADDFAKQSDEARGAIVTVLETLESDPPGRRFSQLSPKARLAHLQRLSHSEDWARPREERDRANFPSQASRDRTLAATLARLVLVPLEPDPIDADLFAQPIEAI